jgi:hypothetical protein
MCWGVADYMSKDNYRIYTCIFEIMTVNCCQSFVASPHDEFY